MTDELDALRAQVQAMAAANRQLATRIEIAQRHRRADLADEWIATLLSTPIEGPARLVKAADGTMYLVEGDWKRAVRSGLLAVALERLLGPHVIDGADDDAAPDDDGVVPAGDAGTGDGAAAADPADPDDPDDPEDGDGDGETFPDAAPPDAIAGDDAPSTTAVLDDLEDGPPVEIFESAHGAPFVVVAGQRLPLRGLPLPHPLAASGPLALEEGPELDIGSLRPTEELSTFVPAPVDVGGGPPLPTFLLIGAQKSATRWLRSNLDAHPEVFTAPGEPGYFNDERRLKQGGLSWYRAQFEGWAGEPCVGESTPGYLMWTEGPDEIAVRIRRTIPDVRLLALLRNPIDRARSAMVHHVVKGRLGPETDLLELVGRVPPEQDQLGLVAGGWYAASLRPYLERFGDQLLVLVYDDVLADPQAVYRRALAHIGASPDFLPMSIDRVRESQEGLDHGVPPLDDEQRKAMYEYFRDDIAELEVMLGRSLASWGP
jgi:hypothetical protein